MHANVKYRIENAQSMREIRSNVMSKVIEFDINNHLNIKIAHAEIYACVTLVVVIVSRFCAVHKIH